MVSFFRVLEIAVGVVLLILLATMIIIVLIAALSGDDLCNVFKVIIVMVMMIGF